MFAILQDKEINKKKTTFTRLEFKNKNKIIIKFTIKIILILSILINLIKNSVYLFLL